MDKTYQAELHEQKIYGLWENGGYFTPPVDPNKKPFTIMIPPPNVNGSLHIGHALTLSIEDILVRYHRMKGLPTLYLPGKDHASIAVHNVFEKELVKEGKNRFDLGRGKFLERVWKWVENYGHLIEDQERKLGISVDWTRNRFTMDREYQESVRVAFDRLKEKGLIYQGEYIVNWCPHCQTVISDLENIHQETKGWLWYLDYGTITITTTRPETIFADVAVAVNPKDSRYKNLIGKFATIPLVNRQIPIIKDELVDTKFGTGALKITPAHDPIDFEIGQRHDLPHPIILDKQGKLTNGKLVPKKYWGLETSKARGVIAQDLKASGFVRKEDLHIRSVGHCQRCNTITEPIISNQWFVKTTALVKPAIEIVKKGEIKIIPRRFEKIYFQWMENIRDWCISRQLWWGHPIPQTDDILDTWFSSALWPFATLGWPKKTKDYEYFYPTAVLETGYDILFFWVARMIMMGIALTGKVPFETVYLHGLVRDVKGQKMSKTLGNVIDPLSYVEKYGADALRMALVVGTTPGNDSKISEEKVLGYRNFTNKIWNIARFVLNVEGGPNAKIRIHSNNLTSYKISMPHPDDKWVLDELNKTINSVTQSLDNFQLSPAGGQVYDFIWHRFADVYIEKTKDRRREAQSTLLFVLDRSLRLLHPFMPFVTETIWQEARRQLYSHGGQARDKNKFQSNEIFNGPALAISKWPEK